MKRLVRAAQRKGFEEALPLGLELQASLLKCPEFASYVESLRQRLQEKSNVQSAVSEAPSERVHS